MDKEQIQKHIKFIESILSIVGGEKHTAVYGKTKASKDKAYRQIEFGILKAKGYLNQNNDLYEFMLDNTPSPMYFESLEWKYIETDFHRFLIKLKEIEKSIPEQSEEE